MGDLLPPGPSGQPFSLPVASDKSPRRGHSTGLLGHLGGRTNLNPLEPTMTDQNTTEPVRIDALLTIEEVAELLRMPVASLRYWRVLGTGPRGFIIGRRLRYVRADVFHWLVEQRENDPTAA